MLNKALEHFSVSLKETEDSSLCVKAQKVGCCQRESTINPEALLIIMVRNTLPSVMRKQSCNNGHINTLDIHSLKSPSFTQARQLSEPSHNVLSTTLTDFVSFQKLPEQASC